MLKASIQLERNKLPIKVLIDLGSNSIITLDEKRILESSFNVPVKKIRGIGSEGLADGNMDLWAMNLYDNLHLLNFNNYGNYKNIKIDVLVKDYWINSINNCIHKNYNVCSH